MNENAKNQLCESISLHIDIIHTLDPFGDIRKIGFDGEVKLVITYIGYMLHELIKLNKVPQNNKLVDIDNGLYKSYLEILNDKNIPRETKQHYLDELKELLKSQIYTLYAILCKTCDKNPIRELLLKKQALLNRAIENAKNNDLFSYFNPPKSQKQYIKMDPTIIFGNPKNPNYTSKHRNLINYFENRNGNDTPNPFERTPSMVPDYGGGIIIDNKLILAKLFYKAYKKLNIIAKYNKK